MIWLPEVGVFLLLCSMGASFCSLFTHQRFWVAIQCACVLLAFLLLGFLFYICDFSVLYVLNNANTTLPWYYRLSAVWGAHEGSLLLWLLWLNIWTFLVSTKERWVAPLQKDTLRILSVLHSILSLFILSLSNPFSRMLPIIPLEGADLNPLLQDIGLILHPPILYGGYVGFAVPFAFVMALLWKGAPELPWSKWLQPWVQGALTFLTLGITLGSWWAYYELGWGGWWFWDPVENASFMPWLSGLALLHLLILHRMTGAYAAWCILASIITFGLCLIGTFLVRSGVLTSVHAFASDPGRGLFILVFIATVLGAGFTLYAARISHFLSEKLTELLKTRLLLLASALILASCATVFLGTLYPLLIDAWSGQKLSVGPPYFNAVFVPFMIPLALLCAILPALPWSHRFSWVKQGGWLFLGFGVPGCLLYYGLPAGKHWWLTFFGVLGAGFLGLSTIKTVAGRFWQTKKTSMSLLGMGLAHVGFAFLIAGISLTTHLDIEKDLRLKVGDNVELRQWTFNLDDFERSEGSNYQGVRANLSVLKAGVPYTSLHPEKRYYAVRDISMSETALSPGFWQDLYVALSEPISREEWVFRIYLKPFVRWIWLGGVLMALGLLIVTIGRRKLK